MQSSINFDPKEVLASVEVGLCVMSCDFEKDIYEMHPDKVTEKLLGIKGDLSPLECNDFWYGRIKKEYNVINLDYVFYLLPIPLLEINKNTSSVTVKHLSNKQIDNLLFPIPPLNEQTIIVNKITELFSILDKISLNLV